MVRTYFVELLYLSRFHTVGRRSTVVEEKRANEVRFEDVLECFGFFFFRAEKREERGGWGERRERFISGALR